MTIDPKTLPDEADVETTADHFAYGQTYLTTAGNVRIRGDLTVLRVFVPVPDGVAYDDALRAVGDARPWVPLPDGPTESHVGARVRLVSTLVSDVIVQDRISAWFGDGEVRLSTCGDNWYPDSGDWFVHPDDAPDPDADLIERMAKAILEGDPMQHLEFDRFPEQVQDSYRTAARAALAVIREDGAR